MLALSNGLKINGSDAVPFFSDEKLRSIWRKVCSKERLDRTDGLAILNTSDLIGLGFIADRARAERAGDIVTFVGNFHICYTNICSNQCRLCIFRKSPDQDGAFTLDLNQVGDLIEQCKEAGVPEVLILGGVNPELPFSYFVEMLDLLRAEIPDILILGFSPVEIDHFEKETGMPAAKVLETLSDHGLHAITGGGAEIFSPRIRNLLGCEDKISGERWLEIMEAAHGCGVRSNACIMYGAGENHWERLDHLDQLRSLQDRTNGFTHILPFAFSEPDRAPPTGFDDLKMIALCRLYLDNFTHIRAYWSHLGLKGAQVALSFGADDLNGLRQKGRIIHSSGGQPPSFSDIETMVRIIRDAGRTPAQRDILFNIVETFPD